MVQWESLEKIHTRGSCDLYLTWQGHHLAFEHWGKRTYSWFIIMAENNKNDNSGINRHLGTILKTMDKLQKCGVLCNISYCLPTSGTVYTRGWPTMENVILNTLRKESQDKVKEVIQRDLKNNTDSSTQTEPKVFLGSLPFAQDVSRDQLRPLLVEMVRVSQSKG